jgi:hypothetical protein
MPTIEDALARLGDWVQHLLDGPAIDRRQDEALARHEATATDLRREMQALRDEAARAALDLDDSGAQGWEDGGRGDTQ